MNREVNAYFRESCSFEWRTTLPHLSDRHGKTSPSFILYKTEARLSVQVNAAAQFKIKLFSENLEDISAGYSVYLWQTRHEKLIQRRDRLNSSSVETTLLSFDLHDINNFPNFSRFMPVYISLKLSGYAPRDLGSKVHKCVQTASYRNASRRSGDLTDTFEKIFKTCQDADIEVKCGEEVIKAHSFILCSRSEVLKAMLRNDGQIKFTDMNHEAFEALINFLYTDTLPELDFHKAKYLYEKGDMYALPSLMRRCAEFLVESLSPKNAFDILTLSYLHSDKDLKAKATNYIVCNKIYLHEAVWAPFYRDYKPLAIDILNMSHKVRDSA